MKRMILMIAVAVMAALAPLPAVHVSALSLFGREWNWNGANTTGQNNTNSYTYYESNINSYQSNAGNSTMTDTGTDYPCLRYSDHVYEVCSAYVANASLAVLVPYYKYAASPNTGTSRYVGYRLGSRYYGDAYDTIRNRVAAWPGGTRDVAIPTIRILSVSSNLQTNTATLTTEETWRVTDKNDRIVYQESNVRHAITMQRVPSYFLHKWVVTDIR